MGIGRVLMKDTIENHLGERPAKLFTTENTFRTFRVYLD